MTPRDYQSDCHGRVFTEFGSVDSTLVVLPTGMGKTVLFSMVARDWAERMADDRRALVIAPTIELVDQAAHKLEAVTGQRVGIEQASRQACEVGAYRDPFIAASKQTLMSKRGGEHRYKRINDVGLVIVDEAHGSTTEKYAEVLDHYRGQGAKVLGLTATPVRADGVGMHTLYESCAYKMFIPQALDLGWLVSPKAVCCQLESLDLSEVGTKGKRGDFKDGDLAKVMEQEEVVFEVAEITARESVVDGRTLRTVVYCATVAEARAVSQRLNDKHKIRADWVCGDKKLCPPDRREQVLREFASEEDPLTHVCNVGVLTTGWDCPNLEHIVTARPTRSLALYTQILGRGTRPLPGVVDFEGSTPETRRDAIAASAKPHFKVTDLCDNTLEHRLAGVADVLAGSDELVSTSKGEKPSIEEHARKSVYQKTLAGEVVDVAAAMAAARAAEAKRREAEEELRRKRQQIESDARYKRLEVDELGQAGKGAVRGRQQGEYLFPFGDHKGTPIGEVPIGYLTKLLKAHERKEQTQGKGFLYRQTEWRIRSEISGRRAKAKLHPELTASAPGPPKAKPSPTNQTSAAQSFDAAMAEINALLS